jgi:hypothetical protein
MQAGKAFYQVVQYNYKKDIPSKKLIPKANEKFITNQCAL